MWRHFTQTRDREMIDNIYKHCREKVFDTGVFLVGAAHKMSIATEIEKYASAEADLIDWKFYDGQLWEPPSGSRRATFSGRR
jgi:hypothetical protein